MREKLNSNPILQGAVIGVLLIGTAFFFVAGSGGGEEVAPEATEATVTVAGTDVSGSASGATPGEAVEGAIEAAGSAAAAGAPVPTAIDAPPPPRPVLRAWQANRTVVLLFVREGGIDDRLVRRATAGLGGFSNAQVFVIPAGQIYRYATITQGVGVDRVPALVVLTPRDVGASVPTASVSYGFRSPESIAQAVIDAGYQGPIVDYHP